MHLQGIWSKGRSRKPLQLSAFQRTFLPTGSERLGTGHIVCERQGYLASGVIHPPSGYLGLLDAQILICYKNCLRPSMVFNYAAGAYSAVAQW